MVPEFSTYHMEWLLDDSNGDTPPEDVQFVTKVFDYPLPAELGKAFVERLDLGDEFTLFHATHALEPAPSQLITLMDMSLAPSEPVFAAQTWISGGVCFREYWLGRSKPPTEIIARQGRDTFRRHESWDATLLAEGGIYSEMRSVVMRESTLRTLLGDSTDELLEWLGLDLKQLSVVHSIPPRITAPLVQSMLNQYQGTTRRLYAQARVLDYLTGLLNYITDQNQNIRQSRHASRIRDLHEYLTKIEGRLPTLSELSKDFNLSAQRLNAEFSAEYGESIFSYITSFRLQQAHGILEETQLPIKLLAARLGYTHTNHFNAAFKRKFGYPPGSLRKK